MTCADDLVRCHAQVSVDLPASLLHVYFLKCQDHSERTERLSTPDPFSSTYKARDAQPTCPFLPCPRPTCPAR